MFRLKILMVVLALVPMALISCGGGGNVGKVCDAGAAQVFDECDQTDPTDIATIQAAFATFGEIVTAAEVMSASESDLAGECEAGLNEFEVVIEDVDADAFVTAVNALSTCAEVVSFITFSINQL